MSYTPVPALDLSPVRLNYVGALRGLKPHSMTDAALYAQVGAFAPEALIRLAASNPHASFFGLVANDAEAKQANDVAGLRKIRNVTFTASRDAIPDGLHYLVCENAEALPAAAFQEDLFNLAQTKLAPGGLFAYRYKAYEDAATILKFLVSEYAPELSEKQTLPFLLDLKGLGTSYFSDNGEASALLDRAIASRDPSSFFAAYDVQEGAAPSGTFETMAGLLPREFSFVGEADYPANYIELVAPAPSHSVLDKARDHLLYEPLKDFALQRLIRNDVWVKRPVEQTFDNAELYANFTFGIMLSIDSVPQTVATHSGNLSLSSPLYSRLIELMTTLPMSVGDFLHHPAGHGFSPDEVIAAINILVACGIARPMRTHYEGENPSQAQRHVWATPYNAFLDLSEIADKTIALASPIAGTALSVPARDALVLQAINRVGFSQCAGALQPELNRLLEKNPALAAHIMDSSQATDEVVHNIISNVVSNNMGRWFAYGILTA